MKLFSFLCGVAFLGRAATLSVAPPVIYDCQNGEGTATLSWSGASGPVQIHVLKPDGPALTGFNDPSGSTTTGNWVSDGLQFFLVDQAGNVEATATAHVSCGGTANTLNQGLQGGSYFPLQVGNTWVYRNNDRTVTGSYVMRSITGTTTANGLTYYVMTSTTIIAASNQAVTSPVGNFRGDNNGAIWMMTNSGDQVYLDPSRAQMGSYSGPLGTFPDAISQQASPGQIQSQSTFVRGIGLANLQSNLLAGSSGGFTQSLDLVEVRLNGVRLTVPAPSISLAIESTDLDLTDQKAANCALPCYFAACGIGGFPPDPPGTYRPCAETRMETSEGAGDTVELQLLNASGTAVFDTSQPVDASGNAFNYVRLPLYTNPQPASNAFTLLPPGSYKLVGKLLASGVETASSVIDVLVR